MPESWRAELMKLRGLKLPEDLWSRIELRATLDRSASPVERIQAPRSSRPGLRVAVAFFALLIATVGSLGVFLTIHHAGGRAAPGGTKNPSAPSEAPTTPFAGIWPEPRLADAEAAQASVDSGDPSLQWRLLPDEVAGRFAKQVMGWTSPVPESCGHFGQGQSCDYPAGTGIFTVHKGCLVCGPDLIVEVQQLVRIGHGGIWSVTRASGGGTSGVGVDLPIEPGFSISPGQSITVHPTLPQGAGAELGYAYFAGSCESSGGTTHVEPDGTLTLQFTADVLGSCGDSASGYVYAAISTQFQGQGAAVDPLTAGVPLDVLLVVPVQFTNPAPATIGPSSSGS